MNSHWTALNTTEFSYQIWSCPIFLLKPKRADWLMCFRLLRCIRLLVNASIICKSAFWLRSCVVQGLAQQQPLHSRLWDWLALRAPTDARLGGKCDPNPELGASELIYSKGQYFFIISVCTSVFGRGKGVIRWWWVLGLVRFLQSRHSCLLSFPPWSEFKKKKKKKKKRRLLRWIFMSLFWLVCRNLMGSYEFVLWWCDVKLCYIVDSSVKTLRLRYFFLNNSD